METKGVEVYENIVQAKQITRKLMNALLEVYVLSDNPGFGYEYLVQEKTHRR